VTVEDVPGALWLSAIGSLSDRDAHGAVLGYEQSTYGLVGGADFGTRLGENATLLFGVQAGHVGSSMDVSDGLGSDVDLDGTSIGASASLLSGNFFANVQVSADFLKSDIRIGASPTVDTDAATYGIRSDMGYRLENGNGLFIEPMVSVLASQTNLDSFVISGVTFEDSSNDMFLLGAGSRLGLASDGFSASVTARVWNNLSDDNTIVLTPVGPALTVTDSGLFGGTFGEVEGKASVDFNENGNFASTRTPPRLPVRPACPSSGDLKAAREQARQRASAGEAPVDNRPVKEFWMVEPGGIELLASCMPLKLHSFVSNGWPLRLCLGV
jgi:outer membrane autotransporter protein